MIVDSAAMMWRNLHEVFERGAQSHPCSEGLHLHRFLRGVVCMIAGQDSPVARLRKLSICHIPVFSQTPNRPQLPPVTFDNHSRGRNGH